MTYRKLFLCLFTCATLAIAALWTWSCWGCAGMSVGELRGYGHYQAEIWSGTVMLGMDSSENRPTKAETDAIPLNEHFFLPRPPDEWEFDWHSSSDLTSRYYKYPRTGRFAWEKRFYPIVMDHSTMHYSAYYQLDFPLWVPWLLMVAAAYAITRWLERRSAGSNEKKLAQAKAADHFQDRAP